MDMHKIAVRLSLAPIRVKLPAARDTEIGHRGKLTLEHSTSVVATIVGIERRSCLIFVLKPHIRISNHVIPQILKHLDLLHSAKLPHLLEQLFVKVIELELHQAVIKLPWVAPRVDDRDERIEPNFMNQDSL